MKKAILCVLIFFIFGVLLYADILIIQVDAPIHPVTSEYIRAAIDRAEEENAALLIMKINTPGGLDSSMREIIERILSSRVPVATFVYPSGARSASAGFFIGIASDLYIMAPGTNTGSAHPVGISMTGQKMDETMSDKVTNDAAAYIKSLAEKRGRNISMAVAGVRNSQAFTEKEALDGGLIDLIASTESDIIRELNGQTITRFDGGEQQLLLADEDIVK